MSAFSTSPRPRIVNGVLIRECSDKSRCNGLQGTNSKEDFYRAIVEMPSPIPEDDTRPAEPVSAECGLHCNYSPQENYSKVENVNRPTHFSQERRNITGHSEPCSAHCDHRQAFESQESEQQTPSFCTHSNSHNYSTVAKLDMGQHRIDADTCHEGKHVMHIDKWESGDHHRSMVDGLSPHNDEDRHYSPDNYCYNAPTSLDRSQPKYLYKGSSPQNARRDSTLEECQDHIHRHTCPHNHDAVLIENKPLLRTPNSTRLHEEAIDSSHGNTANCIALMNSEDSCNSQNALREPSPRGKNRTMQYEKPDDLIYPHASSPEFLHIPQVCRPQDEQSEHSQAAARDAFNITEGHLEEFSGYPPQRRIIKQHNVPIEDENFPPHGKLNVEALWNKKPECRRFIRRKAHLSNVTEREARSVAEILNHPVMDVHSVESETLAPQCSPPLRTLNSGEDLGYPPQPTSLLKSKYSAPRACEHNSQNEEPRCNYNSQKKQVIGHYDHSNDTWIPVEDVHEQKYAGQRRNVKFGNEYEAHDEYCRAYNKTGFHHPQMSENERKETVPHGSVQDTVCVNQEQNDKNICIECSPRTFHPETQEHYHSHHYSNTPDEEINNFSVKKLPKEARCHAPVSCEDRKSHFHHRDDIINEVNSRRKNGGNTKSSCRPVSARQEDEYYRKENENLIHRSDCHINENPISSSVKHSDGYLETYENVSGEGGHTLQANASHEDLQVGEREKYFAQSTHIPTRSHNYCEAEHVRDNPHPRVTALHSKTTKGLGKYPAASPCEVNKHDDDIVPGHTDGGALELSGLNEQCITKPYRRMNGLEDEDIEITNAENRDVCFEENNKEDARKHRVQFLQDARKHTTSQNNCETLSKLNHTHSMTGASEERKHPSNLTSKTRIPKMKPNVHSASNKNNTVAGCLQQRPKRTTSLKL